MISSRTTGDAVAVSANTVGRPRDSIIFELEVLGAKVVPPLADAVCFVHDEEFRRRRRQRLDRAFRGELFRSQQEVFQVSVLKVGERVESLSGCQRRVELGRHSGLPFLDGVDLVLLEGDHRRHHDGRSGNEFPRNLVDERFPGARRKDDQRVPAHDDGLDGIELSGPKVANAQVIAGDLCDRSSELRFGGSSLRGRHPYRPESSSFPRALVAGPWITSPSRAYRDP